MVQVRMDVAGEREHTHQQSLVDRLDKIENKLSDKEYTQYSELYLHYDYTYTG